MGNWILLNIFNNICSLDNWKKIEEITLYRASPYAKLKMRILVLTDLLTILCCLSEGVLRAFNSGETVNLRKAVL